jgi:hypothetical protein
MIKRSNQTKKVEKKKKMKKRALIRTLTMVA